MQSHTKVQCRQKEKSIELDPYASWFFDDMLHTHLLQLTGTVWLNTVFKKQWEKDICGERKRSAMARLVEKVGHAFCYIHSKDAVEYPVLAWTVQVRYPVCLHTTRGSSKKTNIDPQSSLEKEKFEKRHQTRKSKKEGQVTNATKIPQLLCNKTFFSLWQSRKIRKKHLCDDTGPL